MNAASEMSIWLVVLTIIILQIQFPSINSFSTVYRHSDTGRKLFGGYRIVPKPCTITSDENESKPKTGICMFNYECNQRGGEMIGSCIDGFLFGVCCSLPQSLINIELENDAAQGIGSYSNKLSSPTSKRPIFSSNKATMQTDSPTPKFSRRPEFTSESTSAGYMGEIFTASEDPDELISSLITGNGATYNKIPPKRKPILEQYFSNQTSGGFIDNQGFLPVHNYPPADTILLNPDGTIVEDDKNPEGLFTPPNSHYQYLKPTTQGSMSGSQNKVSYEYVTTSNGQIITVNKHTPIKIESTTKTGMDSTFSIVYKRPTRPFTNKFPGTIGSESSDLHSYITHRPMFTSLHSKPPASLNKFTKPDDITTVSMIYKKTDSVPMPSSTVKTHPSYATTDGNMILVQTVYNRNNTKKPTTISVESTQSTSKASYKPSYLTSRKPVKPTPSSNVDLDDKYPSFNYNSYTGISKPPILITHPVGLDDGGQAISHIIGILNTTNPKPEQIETVTRPMNTNEGLSTWVSIIGQEKPTKYKYPTPGSVKPGVTTTTYVHGPSFSVETNENKPAPTVVVISQDTSGSGYYTKPTKRPSLTSTSIIKNKYSTKKPSNKPSSEYYGSTAPQKPTHYYQNNVLHTGQENLVNFPPVRNPDLNVSGLNQVEKPTVVQSYVPGQNDVVHLPNGITLEVVPDNVDLNTIDPDEDYADFTTPGLHEDKVQNQVHTFVEKIVNSLAGNFQDLENILFKNDNKTTITNANGIQLNNIQVGEVNEKVTTVANTGIFTSTKKPVKRPTTIRPSDTYDTTLLETFTTIPTKKTKPTTKKPPTSYLTTASGIVTKKPSTSPSPTVPVKKPSVITTIPTKRPTIVTNTPTKRPSPGIITASKRPTTTRPGSTISAATVTTTRRPIVTKRPKPTTTVKRTTTSTTEVYDEVTEPSAEDVQETTTGVPQTSAEYSTADYRRECGVRPLVKKSGRIVGGKGSQFGYYPWQVLVRESTWLGLFTKNKCGGVLITNRYVITAAHCQPGFLASLVAVFGEFDISGELEAKRSVAKNVRRVIVHRQYDPATFENDLALLELDSPVTYEEHIVPICMPREGEDYVGRMATVTGWGRLKYGGGVPSVLQEVRVPLIENSVCQEMFQTAGHQKRIISSFLCAGYANGQKDSCEGDSGGPLMVERDDGRWVLLGTVSHGIKCAAPYLPGVYMRTTYYKPWLKSITGVST